MDAMLRAWTDNSDRPTPAEAFPAGHLQVLAYALEAIHETQDNIINAENATESEKAQVRVSPQDLRSVFADLVDEHCIERAPEADLDPPEPFTYRSARRGKGKLAQAEAQADAVRALARVRPVLVREVVRAGMHRVGCGLDCML